MRLSDLEPLSVCAIRALMSGQTLRMRKAEPLP